MSISEHKHRSEPELAPTRRIEIFRGAGRRRTWSVDQNAAIGAESFAVGASAPGWGSSQFLRVGWEGRGAPESCLQIYR
jgi:transposase